MKKIKVTKRVAAKVPWYEKPPLLFGAIAGLLLISGLVMAHLNSRTNSPPAALGPDATDGAAVANGDSAAADSTATEPSHILGMDAPLPTAGSGDCLPPVVVETLRDAVRLREKLRGARGLVESGEAVYGFTSPEAILQAAASREGPDLWESLAPHGGERGPRDFEVQRDVEGQVYLMAFVASEVAEALGVCGPELALSAPPVVDAPPAWQFWRKAPEPAHLELYIDSAIQLHAEVSPEATCGVVLPLTRLRPVRILDWRTGHSRPVDLLEVALQ